MHNKLKGINLVDNDIKKFKASKETARKEVKSKRSKRGQPFRCSLLPFYLLRFATQYVFMV
jgi:hypothetical protein